MVRMGEDARHSEEEVCEEVSTGVKPDGVMLIFSIGQGAIAQTIVVYRRELGYLHLRCII